MSKPTTTGSALTLEKTRTKGVYKRGNRYVVTFRDQQGRQKKRFAATYKEATRIKKSVSADVDRGEFRETSRVTFGEYAVGWIETYPGRTNRGIRDETREGYRRVLEQDAIPFLGRMRLSEIEPEDLKKLAAHIAARGVMPNTVRLSLAPVRALLATAHEERLLRFNPAAGFRTRYTRPVVETDDGEEADDVKAMTEAELYRLLGHLPEAHRLFFEFLSQTGLRISEAIELRWKDVTVAEVGTSTIHVRRRFYRGKVAPPKSKYGNRKLRLSPSMGRALFAIRAETSPAPDDLVFRAERGGRINQSNVAARVLKPACVAAGLGEWVIDPTTKKRRAESWVGFHTFRHTCATSLFRHGWNAVQVQRLLGHHSPSFTLDTYVHLLDEDVPTPAFFDTLEAEIRATERATKEAETSRNAAEPKMAEAAL